MHCGHLLLKYDGTGFVVETRCPKCKSFVTLLSDPLLGLDDALLTMTETAV